jgi:hypothetical protein
MQAMSNADTVMVFFVRPFVAIKAAQVQLLY